MWGRRCKVEDGWAITSNIIVAETERLKKINGEKREREG